MHVRRGVYLNNENWDFLEQRHSRVKQLHTGLDTGLGATASTGSASAARMNPFGHGAYAAQHAAHLQEQQQEQQKQAAVAAYARLRQLQQHQQQQQQQQLQQRGGVGLHPHAHLQHAAYSAPSYDQAQARAALAAAQQQVPHHNPYQHLTAPQHAAFGMHHQQQQHPMAAQTHSQLNHHQQQQQQQQQRLRQQQQQRAHAASPHSAAKSSTTSTSNDSDSDEESSIPAIPAWILERSKEVKSKNRTTPQQAASPHTQLPLATNDARGGGNDSDDATDYSSDDDNADATNWRPVPVSQPAHPSHVARQQYLPTPSVASRTRSSGTSPTHRSAIAAASPFPHQGDASRGASRGAAHRSRSRGPSHGASPYGGGGAGGGGAAHANLPTLDKSALKIHPSRIVHMQQPAGAAAAHHRDSPSPTSPDGSRAADALATPSSRSPSVSKKRPLPPPREPTPEPEPQRLKMRKLLPDTEWNDPPKELNLYPSPLSFEWLNWARGKWGRIREARRVTYRENFGEKQQGRFYNTKTYTRKKKHWTQQRDDPTPAPPSSIMGKVTAPLEVRVFTDAELERKEPTVRKPAKRKRKPVPKKGGGNDAAGGASPAKKAKKASAPVAGGGNTPPSGGKGKSAAKGKAKTAKKTKKPRKPKPKKPKAASAASPSVKSSVPSSHVPSNSSQNGASSHFAASPSQTPQMNGTSSSSSRYGSSSMSAARSQSPHIANGISHGGIPSGSGRGPSTYSSGDLASSVSPSPVARSHNSSSAAAGRTAAAALSRSHSRNSDPSAQSHERDPMMDHSANRFGAGSSHKVTSSLAEPHNFLKTPSAPMAGSASSDDPFSQPLLGGTGSGSSFRNGAASASNGLFGGTGSDGLFDHGGHGGRGSVVSHMDGVHDPFSLAPDDRSPRSSLSHHHTFSSAAGVGGVSGAHSMSSPFAPSPRGSDPYGFAASGSRFA